MLRNRNLPKRSHTGAKMRTNLKEIITFRTTPEIHEELQKIAESQKRKVAQVVAIIIEDWFHSDELNKERLKIISK